jgi:hypothetical protein
VQCTLQLSKVRIKINPSKNCNQCGKQATVLPTILSNPNHTTTPTHLRNIATSARHHRKSKVKLQKQQLQSLTLLQNDHANNQMDSPWNLKPKGK